MPDRVLIAPAAVRELRGLPRRALARIDARIAGLAADPRPAGVVHLQGELHRIRVGDMRVVYAIRDEETTVLVLVVADRKEVYRRLRRLGLT